MMSVSSFSNFSILIKKIARKSSLRRFTITKKQRAQSCLHKTTNTTIQDQDIGSISTCSSNEEENNINNNNKSVLKNVPVTTKTEKQQQQQQDNLINNDNDNNDNNNNKNPTLSSKKSLDTISSSHPPQTTTVINKTEENDEESIDEDTIQVSIHNNDDENENDDNNNDNNKHDDIPKIKIRDFGYATTSSLHHGPPPSLIDYQSSSQISLSSTRFNGRQAHALYDFIPETDYEVAMNAGQSVWIQYRQCDGWLMAEIGDEAGLVPESYIEFI